MILPQHSATELTRRIAQGALKPSELMEETLARIDEVNPKVNAIVALRSREDLLAEARAADRADPVGRLHGIPIAVKDLVNVAGIRSTNGSPVFADFVPEKDALLAARLRVEGAILIGKTNVPEFGLGSHTFNPVYGTTKNPYALDLTCGGSSGGAAVALATGMVALADGSDMMGSLRNPAAWNNVYGLRPSHGLVPSEPEGDMYLHHSSTLGPMARSPEDIALLLDVIAGPDPRWPNGLDIGAICPLPISETRGKRIGWLGDWGGAIPLEDGILDQCENGLSVLQQLGCSVDPVAAPFPMEQLWESWITLRSWQIAGAFAPLLDRPEMLKDSAIWEIERGVKLSAMDVHHASVIRSEWFRQAVALFDNYDALVMPTVQVWPFPVEQEYPQEIAGREMDTYHRWMETVVPVSLIGLPSLGMPVGFGPGGLPMGMQIFGAKGSDRDLLALGTAYHTATQWPQKRPAL